MRDFKNPQQLHIKQLERATAIQRDKELRSAVCRDCGVKLDVIEDARTGLAINTAQHFCPLFEYLNLHPSERNDIYFAVEAGIKQAKEAAKP